MKNGKLLIIAVISIVLGMSSAAFATLIEITEIDSLRGATTEVAFGDYVNSGDLLGVFEKNDSNQLGDISAWMILNKGYSFDFVMEEYFKDEYEDDNAATSGTWESDMAISFYVVKAADAFALYDVDPFANEGTWSTYDLWIRGLGGSALEISHITGYNSVTGTNSTDPVPEPATMFLLGSGLLGFARFRRKA